MICLNNTDTIEAGASVASVVDYSIHGLVSGAFTVLASGQLSDTDPSVLYTAAENISIVSVTFVNTHSAAVDINFYIDALNAGSPRRLIPKNLTLGVGYSLHFDGQRCSILNRAGALLSTLAAGAIDISVSDSDDYYTGTNVETVLAEIGETRNESGWDLLDENSLCDIAFDLGTRTITTSVKGGQSSYHFWANSKKITKTGNETVVIPTTSGGYYIYFDNDGVLQYVGFTAVTAANFYENAIVAWVYYNAVKPGYLLGAEQHGKLMSPRTHHYNHNTFGARFESGMDITGLVNGNTTYTSITSGYFWDEDIRHSVPLQTDIPFIHRLGADGLWAALTTDTAVSYKAGGDTYHSWNEYTGGSWQLTEGGSTTSYWVIFTVAMPALNFNGYAKVIGQNAYSTRSLARDAIGSEINTLSTSGLPSQEFVFLQAYIVKRDGTLVALANGDTHVDLRIVKGGSASSSSGSNVAADISISDAGNIITATNVEDALQENRTAIDLNTTSTSGAIMDSDITPAEGLMRKTGNGAYTAIKTNLSASVAPGVDDDTGNGYSVGSPWVDTTNDKAYVCLDAASGIAVWKETTASGGGGSNEAADITIADIGGIITATNVEDALQENRTAIDLNTAKETNVSTTLSTGTVGASTYGITSDGGVDDVVIAAATNAVSGVATASHISAIEANTSANHTQNTDTNLGAIGTKATPIDADKVIQRDSADSDVIKTSSWTQIKSFLKTYFDTLYNNYVHPNHSGDVTSVADGTQTITDDAVTYAKMQNVTQTNVILGRDTVGSGIIEEISPANIRTMINVEDDADKTSTSGAIMDSDITPAEGLMRKSSAGTYTAIKTNLNSETNPTFDNDTGDGYSVGSPWLNTTDNEGFLCFDSSSGAAVWKKIDLSDIPLTAAKGFTLGGYASTTVIEDLIFSSETSQAITATLDTAKYAGTGVDSDTKGYLLGGIVATTVIEDLIFSNETSQVITATLDTAKDSGAGVSSSTKGYIMGGNTGSATAVIEDLIFVNETSQTIAATLDTAKHSGDGVSSSTKGYMMGGYVTTTVIEDLIFSNETSQAITATLDTAKHSNTGVNSDTKGYTMGGNTGSVSAVIEDLIFSGETSQVITATLDTAKEAGAGVNSDAKGYIMGGNTGSVTTVIEDLIFSGETSQAIAATLDTAKRLVAGVSS